MEQGEGEENPRASISYSASRKLHSSQFVVVRGLSTAEFRAACLLHDARRDHQYHLHTHPSRRVFSSYHHELPTRHAHPPSQHDPKQAIHPPIATQAFKPRTKPR